MYANFVITHMCNNYRKLNGQANRHCNVDSTRFSHTTARGCRKIKLIIIIGATTCATLCYWCCGARKLTVFIAVDYGSFLLAAL